jgi:hypothetical protein
MARRTAKVFLVKLSAVRAVTKRIALGKLQRAISTGWTGLRRCRSQPSGGFQRHNCTLCTGHFVIRRLNSAAAQKAYKFQLIAASSSVSPLTRVSRETCRAHVVQPAGRSHPISHAAAGPFRAFRTLDDSDATMRPGSTRGPLAWPQATIRARSSPGQGPRPLLSAAMCTGYNMREGGEF